MDILLESVVLFRLDDVLLIMFLWSDTLSGGRSR